MNYEKDLSIDETSLDVEWIEQANLALRYGRHYAICRKNLTEAEEKVKFVKANLVKKVNEDPVGTTGKEKPTLSDVEAYYRTHRQHLEAKQEWIQAQYDLDMAEIAKNEVCFTRKAALENLVVLFGQGYFAGPKEPRNIFEVMKERRKMKTEKIDDAISIKMTRGGRT